MPKTSALQSLFLIVLVASCGQDEQKPQPVPQQTAVRKSVPSFDGQQAFKYLTAQTDFGPRVPGTSAHQRCLDHLRTEMQKYADAVNLQPFTHTGYDGKPIGMTNIISSFNLKASTRILLLAHWDSRSRADEDPIPTNREKPVLGANDGASGVAVLMEIARHLKAQPPNVGIDMLFTDGEDYGMQGDNENYLLGARHFAKHLPDGFKPAYGILLDMVGDIELEIAREPNSMRYAPDVVDWVWSTAKELNVHQFTDEVQSGVLDDHIPLNEAGIRTVDLIDFDYPYWHTTDDTPDKCSPESLEAVGKVLMHIIYDQPL